MEILSRLLNPILGVLLTLVFGFWLSRREKPYNGLQFNVHKLIALVTVILSVIITVRSLEALDTTRLSLLSLGILGLSVIALFVSGALMSAGKGKYRVMKLIQCVSPFTLVIAMSGTIYLL